MHQKKLKIAITTYPEQAQAEQIAKILVRENLAACVQLDAPITSVYSWQGSVECEKEVRVWIKCKEEMLKDLEEKVKQHHPYETPQWIVLKADQASAEYLSWVYGENS